MYAWVARGALASTTTLLSNPEPEASYLHKVSLSTPVQVHKRVNLQSARRGANGDLIRHVSGKQAQAAPGVGEGPGRPKLPAAFSRALQPKG